MVSMCICSGVPAGLTLTALSVISLDVICSSRSIALGGQAVMEMSTDKRSIAI
jgi:hypothetical protein